MAASPIVGRLGAADLSAATNTTIYTVPAGRKATVSCRFTNRTGAATTIRLAMSTTGTPGASEWIEYDSALSANGIVEDSGLTLSAGQRLVAYATAASVSCVAYGVENDA